MDERSKSNFEADVQTAVDSIQKGDPSGMRKLVTCVGPRLFGFLLRLLGNQADAEDVLQETFSILSKKSSQQNPVRGSAVGWVFSIAKHEACHLIRKRGRESDLMENLIILKGPSENAERQISSGNLHNALNTLPLDFKIPLLMKEFLDLSYSEIAQLTDKNVNQVAQEIYRARSQLRVILKEESK
ncbi:RNA polymerase sigma factor [bacterium]|nr:RNA polymerase sigma factor [bacterium]